MSKLSRACLGTTLTDTTLTYPKGARELCQNCPGHALGTTHRARELTAMQAILRGGIWTDSGRLSGITDPEDGSLTITDPSGTLVGPSSALRPKQECAPKLLPHVLRLKTPRRRHCECRPTPFAMPRFDARPCTWRHALPSCYHMSCD